MKRKAVKRKQPRLRARRVIDDSPQAIRGRLEKFVERARGWGRRAAEMALANDGRPSLDDSVVQVRGALSFDGLAIREMKYGQVAS